VQELSSTSDLWSVCPIGDTSLIQPHDSWIVCLLWSDKTDPDSQQNSSLERAFSNKKVALYSATALRNGYFLICSSLTTE